MVCNVCGPQHTTSGTIRCFSKAYEDLCVRRHIILTDKQRSAILSANASNQLPIPKFVVDQISTCSLAEFCILGSFLRDFAKEHPLFTYNREEFMQIESLFFDQL